MVPGHPEHGPFYLVKGLLNAIERYEWQESSGAKARVLISLLPLLCAYGQRTLPYTVPKVDSNDVLYGGKASYLTELATYVPRARTHKTRRRPLNPHPQEVTAAGQQRRQRAFGDAFAPPLLRRRSAAALVVPQVRKQRGGQGDG